MILINDDMCIIMIKLTRRPADSFLSSASSLLTSQPLRHLSIKTVRLKCMSRNVSCTQNGWQIWMECSLVWFGQNRAGSFAVSSVFYTTSTHASFETSNRELNRLISFRKFHFVAAPVTHGRRRKTMKRTIVAALIQIMLSVSSFKMYYVSRKRKYA